MSEGNYLLYVDNDNIKKHLKILLNKTKNVNVKDFEKCKNENIVIQYSPELYEYVSKLLFKENNLLLVSKNSHFKDIYKLSNKFFFSFVFLEENYKTDDLYLVVNIFKNWCDKKSQYEKTVNELEDKIFDVALASTDILEKNEEMEDLISKDGLTKLYNHSFFKERLAEEFTKCIRYGGHFSLAILDLDFFKYVNDRFGHLKGDDILKTFAQCITNNIRKCDFAARYGGEEFAIIFPETGYSDALTVVARIQREFSAMKFESDDQEFSVTFSAGISNFKDNYENADELLHAADNALYKSKRNGRNKISKAD